MEAFGGDLLEYAERSSPRVAVHGRVYTSTEYPSEQAICLHNENSYQHAWPLKLGFFCLQPPTTGGETPIADVRRVLARLDPDVREQFARRRVLYVRNYRHGVGLPWSTVFQTTSADAVDAYCRDAGIETRWWPDGRLCTRQVRHAVVRHPQTGEPVWFNHAAFFHVTSLPAAVRAALEQSFAEEELPTQTYFGDGGAIDRPLLDHVRAAYRAETVTFAWERGDLLLLDNMLVAHGRAPYSGPRRILVAMAERVDAAEVATP
jgi:alpha-ketoglutarate-dependent taurine dioxygenase